MFSRYQQFWVPLVFCFIGGIALGHGLGKGFPLPLWQPATAMAFILVATGLALASRRRWVVRGGFWLAAVVCGGAFFHGFSHAPGPDDVSHLSPQRNALLSATVRSTQPEAGRAILAMESVNGQKVTGLAQLSAGDIPLPPPGTRIRVVGNLSLPYQSPVPGTFDQAAHLKSQHVTALVRRVRQVGVTDFGPTDWTGAAMRFLETQRNRISGVFRAALPSPAAEVLGGIVLGNHAIPVDAETRRLFVQSGLIHFLAASGLNVGIIAGLLMLVARTARLPLRAQLLAALGGVVLYALLAGLSPSVQRASAMVGIAFAFKLADRELSGPALLAVAVAALLLFNPDLVGSLGFQLSVLSTLGLLLMVPPCQEVLAPRLTRWGSGLLLVPLVAQLWVLPLTLHHFSQLPVHSLPLNMLAGLLVLPLTALGFAAGLAGLAWEPLGQGVATLAAPLLWLLLETVRLGGTQSWALLHLPSPEPWLVVWLYGLLGAVAAGLSFRLKPLLAAPPRQQFGLVMGLLLLLLAPAAWVKHTETGAPRLEIVPLSYTHQVVLLYSQDRTQPMALFHRSPDAWAWRTLSNYFRFRGIRRFAAFGGTGLEPLAREAALQVVWAEPGSVVRAGDWTVTPAGETGWTASLPGGFCLDNTGRLCALRTRQDKRQNRHFSERQSDWRLETGTGPAQTLSGEDFQRWAVLPAPGGYRLRRLQIKRRHRER